MAWLKLSLPSGWDAAVCAGAACGAEAFFFAAAPLALMAFAFTRDFFAGRRCTLAAFFVAVFFFFIEPPSQPAAWRKYGRHNAGCQRGTSMGHRGAGAPASNLHK